MNNNLDSVASSGAAAARIADGLAERFAHHPDWLPPDQWTERDDGGAMRPVSEHLVRSEVLRRLRALMPEHDARVLDEVFGLVTIALYSE